MSDKSYVTMAICPICTEDTGDIVIDMRLRPVFDRRTVFPEVCTKCRSKYLTQGVLVINPRTGSLVVLKDDAFVRAFDRPVPEKRIAFVEEDVIQAIMSTNTD